MNIPRQKEYRGNLIDIVQDCGNTDYIINGSIIKNAPIKTVMVNDENDLELLVDYEPATIAYTSGYKDMWQKGTDGTWTSLL